MSGQVSFCEGASKVKFIKKIKFKRKKTFRFLQQKQGSSSRVSRCLHGPKVNVN